MQTSNLPSCAEGPTSRIVPLVHCPPQYSGLGSDNEYFKINVLIICKHNCIYSTGHCTVVNYATNSTFKPLVNWQLNFIDTR